MYNSRDFNELSQALSLRTTLSQIGRRSMDDPESDTRLADVELPKALQGVVGIGTPGDPEPLAATTDDKTELSQTEADYLNQEKRYSATNIIPKRSAAHASRNWFKLPVFLEPAERLMYKLFSMLFFRSTKTYSPDQLTVELVLILILALAAMVAIWLLAAFIR